MEASENVRSGKEKKMQRESTWKGSVRGCFHSHNTLLNPKCTPPVGEEERRGRVDLCKLEYQVTINIVQWEMVNK